MRCFVGVQFSEDVVERIQRVQHDLSKKEFFTGKLTKPEHLHVTLKFLGDIPENLLPRIKERLQDVEVRPCDVLFDKLGVFSPAVIRIIWLHVTGLDELQRAVDDALHDMFPPEQRFMSHLTIVRPKEVKSVSHAVQTLKEYPLTPFRARVTGFTLFSSTLTPNGPVYEALERYERS